MRWLVALGVLFDTRTHRPVSIGGYAVQPTESLYHHYRDEALRTMGLLSHDDDPPHGWTFDERVWTAAIYARIALMRKADLFGDDALTRAEREALGWNEQAGFDTDLGRWYLLGARYLALNAVINGRLAEVLGQGPN